MPAVMGSCCHAAVRCVFHVRHSVRDSISKSRGEMTNELQLRFPCILPAAVDIQSRSMAVGLAIVVIAPTIGSKSRRAFRSHFSSDSMWMGVSLPDSMWMWMQERGASLVLPRLGRALSMARTVGKFSVEMVALAAERKWAGMSIHRVGPTFDVKKLGCQNVSLGVTSEFGLPKVKRATHLCACMGACAPDTMRRDGGVSKFTSTTTSFHLSCRIG